MHSGVPYAVPPPGQGRQRGGLGGLEPHFTEKKVKIGTFFGDSSKISLKLSYLEHFWGNFSKIWSIFWTIFQIFLNSEQNPENRDE